MVYCWHVAAVETGYALSFYTGPDEQTFELEPGTGVSRFHYAHHGTTNEVEAKLVVVHQGHTLASFDDVSRAQPRPARSGSVAPTSRASYSRCR